MSSNGMVVHGQSSALTAPGDNRMALEPKSFEDGMRLAEVVVASGMFGVKNQADAFVRISTGVALGLSAVQSLRGIYVINGKAGLSADLLMALCLQSPDCEFFRMVESSPTKATFTAKRRNDPQPTTLSFTFEDAKTAGLTTSPMYTKFPAQMLRARCIAALARLAFPERAHGLYTPDELKGGEAPEEMPYVETTATAAPMPTADVAQAAKEVAAAAEPRDWAATVAELRLALDNSHAADTIETLSGQAKTTFKTAPQAVRKDVAEAFKAARQRIQEQDVAQAPAAE